MGGLFPYYFIFLRELQKGALWKDSWYGDESLSVAFPPLFALAVNKEAVVANI